MTGRCGGKKGQEAREVGFWTSKLGSRAAPLPLSQIYSCTQAPLSCPPPGKHCFIRRRDAEQTNLRSNSPTPSPATFPSAHFCAPSPLPFPMPFAGSGAGYAGPRHSDGGPADVICLWQAKAGYLGNSLKVWADDFHPLPRAGVGRVVLEGKTMAQHRSVKPVAGADVQNESVLNPSLGLNGGNRVRNKSPLTAGDMDEEGWMRICLP